jgi:hypothetical protein
MLMWFVCLSIGGVLIVFRDPRLDHRMVALGSVLPIVADVLFGAATGSFRSVGPGHSMVVHVGLLATAMLTTIGRRRLRKRLIAVCLGGFANLVFGGAWARTDSFIWPLTGFGFVGDQPLFERPLVASLLMEAVGLVIGLVLLDRCRLRQPSRCGAFMTNGSLEFLPRPPRRR